MSSLNVALYTSRSALLTNQKMMGITANNLANVDKEGYHRQIAITQMNHPISTPYGEFGTGIHVTSITRSFDLALESGLRQATSEDGRQSTYADRLYRLEGVLAPPNSDSPLTTSVYAFAASLQDLANRPEATDARLDLIAKAESMATQLNESYSDVNDIRDGIATSTGTGTLATKVAELNQYASEINEINSKITQAESRLFNPTQANDLRDRRDALVEKMARLADVSVVEESNKAYSVAIGGVTMIDGTAGTVDDLTLDMSGGSPAFAWTSGPVATITEGELAGLTNAWNYLDGKADDLWSYAQDLGNATNAQLAAGFKPDGTAGEALFDVSTTGDMSVVISDPADIAASDSATASGSGANASTLWSNLHTNDLISQSETIVNGVSGDVSNARATEDTIKAGRTMFQDSIASLSGVSIDEEMIDMLNVQRAFQASSKVVSTVDSMLQTVLNMV